MHELFIVSDLHIGGQPGTPPARGFRMNTRTAELADFFRAVGSRARGPGHSVELVINGDFIDFLAERDPHDGQHHAFIADSQRAEVVLQAVLQREAVVFDALRALLAGGVQLTLLLGNHDLELSLPALREALAQALGAGRGSAARLRFVVDGEAYAVGDVLIEHGNRYDGWNTVDHDALRRLRSESSRRLTPSSAAVFEPPAGSRLVERVMNPIKQDYPFVDLLKPETAAALPLLLALEPGLADRASFIAATRLQLAASRRGPVAPARPARLGDIHGGEEDEVAEAASPVAPPLQQALATRLDPAGQQALQQLLAQARAERAGQAGDIAGGAALGRALSFLQLRLKGDLEARLDVLHAALRALRDDRSFDRSVETDAATLQAAEELAQGGFAVIVFGHTHLAREIELKTARATYLNTGTWADLLRLPDTLTQPDARAARAALTQFAADLQAQRFDAYLAWQPSYAHIVLDDHGRARQRRLLDYDGTLPPVEPPGA